MVRNGSRFSKVRAWMTEVGLGLLRLGDQRNHGVNPSPLKSPLNFGHETRAKRGAAAADIVAYYL